MLYPSPHLTIKNRKHYFRTDLRTLKVRCLRMSWAGVVATIGAMRNAYKNLVGKSEVWRSRGKSRYRWKNIKADVTKDRVWGFGTDRLCGLVVRVSGYRYRGPGFDPRRYQIFWVVVGWNGVHSASWATWIKKSSGSRSRKQGLTAVGTRCADHVTPLYPQKLALTSPTGGGRSVSIVQVRTKATEFFKCETFSRNYIFLSC